MDLIINFYKELDTLTLIIFWGIIIVIILLIILAFISIGKKMQLKKIERENNQKEEDLPIKTNALKDSSDTKKETDIEAFLPSLDQKEWTKPKEESIELENRFGVDEPKKEYNKNLNDNTNDVNKTENNNINDTKYIKPTIEIPTKPYQKNVLREMSLSQTSPIGITRYVSQENDKIKMVKDLEESLNNESFINTPNEIEINDRQTTNYNVKAIEKHQNLNAETNIYPTNQIKQKNSPPSVENLKYQAKLIDDNKINDNELSTPAKDLLINNSINNAIKQEKKESEIYLEEVSRKLSNAEIPDEIERTSYELKQEEDAIISYKELMEKKDSIQTVEEEDAIISIEELMNKSSQKSEKAPEEPKVYNITEEEANDNFIKELKQFRNDL